jgi:predicted TIM-barrel fold metal-dependent hydrolase
VATVIDCDQHLFETGDTWRNHADPAARDLALRIADDEAGNPWLTWRERRLVPAMVTYPGRPDDLGEQFEAVRAGRPPTTRYDDELPRSYWDPTARLGDLDRQGLDAAVVFPNYGLVWERALEDDLEATRVNMSAWNRWAVAVAQEGGGRLLPVAHLTLRDPEFLEAQLAALARGGVRLAMIGPGLVAGKRLSHPDHDRAWHAFVRYGVTPVFHVANVARPFGDAWYETDPEMTNPVLSSVFLWTGAALGLADLVLNGVFDRVPELRLGVMELSAIWVPLFCLYLDGGYDFHRRQNGRPIVELDRRPSEILRDHVRIAAFSYERPDRLTRRSGDLFMACSDYPHAEGTATPMEDYAALGGDAGDPRRAHGLYGGNLRWLLRD